VQGSTNAQTAFHKYMQSSTNAQEMIHRCTGND